MFTCIKNQMSELPTSHDIFATQKNIHTAGPPRFDKVITNLAEEIRQRNQSLHKVDQSVRDRRMRGYFDNLDNKIGSKHRNITPGRINSFKYDGPQMINTKSYKQEFLKGDQDAIYYYERNMPKPTSYQVTMTGCNVKGEPAQILDRNHTSLVGMVTPDPATMTQSNLKFKSLEQDRMNMSRRMF